MIPFNRNPHFVTRLNPKFNSRINPNYNSLINPRFNSAINPRYNSAINPRFNSKINPEFNRSINVFQNSAINPNFNHRLNPQFNSRINPYAIPKFSFPVIYDFSNEMKGILISLESVNGFLVYDEKLVLVSYAISNGEDGYNLFNKESNWAGYLVKTDIGYNQYTLGDIWLKFIVM